MVFIHWSMFARGISALIGVRHVVGSLRTSPSGTRRRPETLARSNPSACIACICLIPARGPQCQRLGGRLRVVGQRPKPVRGVLQGDALAGPRLCRQGPEGRGQGPRARRERSETETACAKAQRNFRGTAVANFQGGWHPKPCLSAASQSQTMCVA